MKNEHLTSVPIAAATLATSIGNGHVGNIEHKRTSDSPKVSVLDKIRQAGGNIVGGKSKFAAAVDEAVEVVQDPQAVETFMETMDRVDQQAIAFGKFDGKKDWYSLPLAEVEAELQGWADSNDSAAQQLLAPLAAFKELQVGVIDLLWQSYTNIVREARRVNSYHELSEFFRNLVAKKLVATFSGEDLRRLPKDVIVLGNNGNRVGYLPAIRGGRVVPMAKTAWPWVQKAEARAAKAKQERLTRMKQLDTGLTSTEAKTGKEGKIFLRIGPNNGAVLQVRKDDKGVIVRMVQTTLRIETPTNWVDWHMARKHWPDDELFLAFIAWKKRG